MKIGDLSRETALSIDTIRYYEKRGLLPPPPRSSSGYRQYGSETVARLRFIVHAKELGFTLEESAQLLALRRDGRKCDEVRSVAEAKAAAIDDRIRKLTRMQMVLRQLANACEQADATDPCPILRALEDDDGDA